MWDSEPHTGERENIEGAPSIEKGKETGLLERDQIECSTLGFKDGSRFLEWKEPSSEETKAPFH